MEPIQGTHKAPKFEPEDFISIMPDNVVTNIMDRLPLQDAVRTGILSRNWRFKWNMLSQLVFDENFFEYLSDRKCENSFGSIISKLLLHLKGAITKCALYIPHSKHVEDISHWILFLSRKGIKDLTLCKVTPLKLPTHLFSCLELKHLKLHNCCFHPPPSFHGFPNLLSLELHHVEFESGKFAEFFTRCPILEILNMHYPRKMFNMGSIGFPEVKLTEIAKLANLKILSLFLCNLDKTGPNSILELMGFLPQLQELDLNFRNCELTEDGATKRFPTTSPCLRTLKLSIIDLGNGIELSYAFQMITSFPNLQTLEITASYQDAAPIPGIYSSEVDYNTTWLLQLRSVVFKNSKGSENEVCLIKYLLAYSPFLKKFVICLHSRLHSHLLCDEKFMFSTTLLKLHRASPVVDIHLY